MHMLEKIKQNPSLFVGFAIPVSMVLFIAGVIYVPQLWNSTPPPQYDFVYATGEGVIYPSYGAGYYSYPYAANGARLKYVYRVVDGKIVKEEPELDQPAAMKTAPSISPTVVVDIEPKFFRFHVSDGTSEALNATSAMQLSLDTNAKSPDGYELVRGNYNGGEFFPFYYGGSGDYYSKYLKRGSFAKKIELNLPQNYYGEYFLGWVAK